MSSRNNNIAAVVRTLSSHIQVSLGSGVAVRPNFPDPNDKLRFPSIIVTGLSPRLTMDLGGASTRTIGTVTDHRAPVNYQVGDYEQELKLDLWCASKADREDLYERLFEIMNPDIHPMGLTLQLDEYFNEKCHYALTGLNHIDDEASSQRGEWRAMIDLVATCRAIRGRTDYIIETVESQVETPDTIEES